MGGEYVASGGSNRFLTMDDLAGRWQTDRRSIQRNWSAWGLTGIRIGRRVLFRERDIENYERKHEERPLVA